jgi:hypothetical protein
VVFHIFKGNNINGNYHHNHHPKYMNFLHLIGVALYNIHFEFSAPAQLLRLVKMCLKDTCGRVPTDKYIYKAFHIQNGP